MVCISWEASAAESGQSAVRRGSQPLWSSNVQRLIIAGAAVGLTIGDHKA